MSVEFNEPEYKTPSPVYTKEEKGIVGLLIKTGLAKNKKQANLVMIGIIAIMAVIFFISISSIGGGGGEEVPADDSAAANL